MEGMISLLVLAWVVSALIGMGMVVSKGYLSSLTWSVGCIMFILVGWWSIPLLLILGPIWLLIGGGLEQKRACPHCRKSIPGSASRCSFCQGSVTPLVASAASGGALPMPVLAVAADLPAEPPVVTSAASGDCRICGASLQDGARFCSRCGRTVGA